MLKYSKLLCGVLFLGASQQAYAQCAIPHSITNGEVADATEVMDNFNAVADCADEGVKPTGTPQTGEIAVVTGPKSITSGNLTGDVTTSGSTQTTLANTGVVAGTYTNPTLTVDEKGRIVSAANGGGGAGGGSSEWTEFVLTNPGAENGTTGWNMADGGFTASGYSTSGHQLTPYEGTYSFVATANANPRMYQTVDLVTYATAIDAGTTFVRLEAMSADTYVPGEEPYVFIVFFDGSGVEVARVYSAIQREDIGTRLWRSYTAETRVPANARSMRLFVASMRKNGTANNTAFDAIRAFIKGF